MCLKLRRLSVRKPQGGSSWDRRAPAGTKRPAPRGRQRQQTVSAASPCNILVSHPRRRRYPVQVPSREQHCAAANAGSSLASMQGGNGRMPLRPSWYRNPIEPSSIRHACPNCAPWNLSSLRALQATSRSVRCRSRAKAVCQATSKCSAGAIGCGPQAQRPARHPRHCSANRIRCEHTSTTTPSTKCSSPSRCIPCAHTSTTTPSRTCSSPSRWCGQ